MSEVAKPTAAPSTAVETDIVRYRSISILAVAGLLLGLASITALAGPVLWFLPLLAILTNAVALRRTSAPDAMLIGRKAALLGLALAVVFGTAAPADVLVSRWILTRQADVVAHRWFEALARGEPHKAHQLTGQAGIAPQDTDPWDFYRQRPEARKGLELYVAEPLTRALLALGPRARIHLLESAVDTDPRRDIVALTYAVTFDEAGRKTTFFARLVLERTMEAGMTAPRWRVANALANVRPASLAE